MLVRCNICNIDVDESMVEGHVSSAEHISNLERVKGMMKDKVYDEDSMRLGIDA